MMKFNYNSDCTFEERVEVVTKEIVEEFPEISFEIAQQVAAIADPVDDKLTNDDIFKRYYNIMLMLNKDNPLFQQVFKDLYQIFQKGLTDEKLIKLMQEIIRYMHNERLDFPLLSEFYN